MPKYNQGPGSKGKDVDIVRDLLSNQEHYDEAGSDIRERTGMSFVTFDRNVGILEEHSIVEQTRKVGNTKMYKLVDEDNARDYWAQRRMCLEE